jgi:4Fe-4S ferredoxin
MSESQNRPIARTNPTKVARASKHPNRPGELCKAEPGVYVPLVSRGDCEGKRDCVEVCPYDVFEVTRITDDDYRALPMKSRFKLKVHGMQTAYTPRADQCQACGLCVVACPEDAIRLIKVSK